MSMPAPQTFEEFIDRARREWAVVASVAAAEDKTPWWKRLIQRRTPRWKAEALFWQVVSRRLWEVLAAEQERLRQERLREAFERAHPEMSAFSVEEQTAWLEAWKERVRSQNGPLSPLMQSAAKAVAVWDGASRE